MYKIYINVKLKAVDNLKNVIKDANERKFSTAQ